jgi:hypothetical protein
MTNKITQEPKKGEWWMCQYRGGGSAPYKYMNGGWNSTNEAEMLSGEPEYPKSDFTPLYKMERAK